MLAVDLIGQCGLMITGSDRNGLELQEIYVLNISSVKTDRELW